MLSEGEEAMLVLFYILVLILNLADHFAELFVLRRTASWEKIEGKQMITVIKGAANCFFLSLLHGNDNTAKISALDPTMWQYKRKIIIIICQI